jgi:g-D-glutamyl-meso-diaminopimelate peptidase
LKQFSIIMLSSSKNVLGGLFVLLVIVGLLVWLWPEAPVEISPVVEEVPAIEEVAAPIYPEVSVIGSSVGGRDISAYVFGSGETEVLFVGGMHGGYEWNSALLAYEFIDHLSNNLDIIPEGVRVSVIPVLNPDGLALVTGNGGRFAATDVPDPSTRVADARFNKNYVDLNRNFDCKWAPESSWKGAPVSAGTAPFSEPEAAALRDYVTSHTPDAVIFWHSQANNVYASECHDGPLPETLAIMNEYANAAGYGAVPAFTAYPITGDAEGWLASIGIPAITVELKTYQSIEWTQNLAGVEAVLGYFSNDNLAR